MKQTKVPLTKVKKVPGGWQVFVYSLKSKTYISQGRPWRTQEAAKEDAVPSNWFSQSFLMKTSVNPIRQLTSEKRVTPWRVLKTPEKDGKFEIWNPASRIVIEGKQGEFSYNLYVYKKYFTSPKKGERRPWYSEDFETAAEMKARIGELVKIPVSKLFSVLGKQKNERIKNTYQKYLDWADEFFRGTALFAPFKEKYTYYREGVIIKLKIETRSSLGAADLVITGENYPPLLAKNTKPITSRIFLGFIGDGGRGFTKDYFLKGWPPFESKERKEREDENKKLIQEGNKPIIITHGIDEEARKVFRYTHGIGLVEDVLKEHLGKPARPRLPDELDDDKDKYLEGPK